MHQDLLRLRREDPTLRGVPRVDGAVLGERAFAVRYFSDGDEDRLLIVNLGPDLCLEPVPEPLLAPLEGRGWRILWSSESPEYGGGGTIPLETTSNWILPGEAAVLLSPAETDELPDARLHQAD
jgi:maltooligosyltrehalose trehalohydrolase